MYSFCVLRYYEKDKESYEKRSVETKCILPRVTPNVMIHPRI